MLVGITGMSNDVRCILQLEAKCGVAAWIILFEVFKIFREIYIALKVLCK